MFVGIDLVVVLLVAVLYKRANLRMDVSEALSKEAIAHVSEGMHGMGDRSPPFRYML